MQKINENVPTMKTRTRAAWFTEHSHTNYLQPAYKC